MKWFLYFCVMFYLLAVTTVPCLATTPQFSVASEESVDWETFWSLQVDYNQGARDEKALFELGAAARKIKYFQYSTKVLRELLYLFPNHVQGRLELAKAYLGSGEAMEAYSLLHSDPETGNNLKEKYLLLGLSAEGIGNFNEAINHLIIYLDIAGPDPLVSLKLATVLYRAERYREAREEAFLVWSTATSTELRDNAEALLHKIASNSFSHWNLQLATGYLYDSNATLGPERKDIFHTYSDYSGASDETARGDQALVLQGSLRHTFNKPMGWSWITLSGINRIDFAHENTGDYLNLYLASGPRYVRRSMDFRLPVNVSGTQYGESNGLTTFRYGIVPEIVCYLTKQWQFRGTLNVQKKKENDAKERSSRILIVSPAIGFSKNNFIIFVGGQVGREMAKADYYSYNLSSIKGSVSREWFKGLNTTTWGGFIWRNYDEPEPDIDETRQDRTDHIGLSILIDLAGPQYKLEFTLKHLLNQSNIPSHKFEKNQFYTMIRMYF